MVSMYHTCLYIATLYGHFLLHDETVIANRAGHTLQ